MTSVTSRSSIKTDKRIELTGALFCLSYTMLKGLSGISKSEGTSLWNFVPNSTDAQSVINWTVVGQLS